MNKILKLALVLLAVSAVVAGVLGVVNELTYPVIDAQKQAKTAEAFASVLKADRFDEIEFDNPDFPTVLFLGFIRDGFHDAIMCPELPDIAIPAGGDVTLTQSVSPLPDFPFVVCVDNYVCRSVNSKPIKSPLTE